MKTASEAENKWSDLKDMKTFELTVGQKAYKVEVDQFDGKRALVKVDGKPYEINVKKTAKGVLPSTPKSVPATPAAQKTAPEPHLAPEPTLAPVASVPSGGQVISPMPGLILEVMVSVGDNVVAGTPVVKIEAMKMENDIPAPVNGTVKDILVKAGDRVSTDETLMVIDEG